MRRNRNNSGAISPVAAVFIASLLSLLSIPASALEAELRNSNGSPTIFVDGKPTSPLMFFGWESGLTGPTWVNLTTEWQEFSITVMALENTDGASGIHFRMGGEGPGKVWVDNIHVYPGEKTDTPAENFARNGDFEGTREDIERDWNFFKRPETDATWTLDGDTRVSGKQSLRIDITEAGPDHMYLHWYQTGYSVKAMQKYTYTLWMKADKPRAVDFMMLHINEPWTIYSAASSPYVQQVRLARDAGVQGRLPWHRQS